VLRESGLGDDDAEDFGVGGRVGGAREGCVWGGRGCAGTGTVDIARTEDRSRAIAPARELRPVTVRASRTACMVSPTKSTVNVFPTVPHQAPKQLRYR
jgi:hypothetical protein